VTNIQVITRGEGLIGKLITDVGIQFPDGSYQSVAAAELLDSTSSTSTTTAATPNSVKTAYDTGFAKFQFLPFRSGATYQNFNGTASVAAVANTTYYSPMYFPNSTTFDRITISTRNTFSGTATIRMGIYKDNGGVPNTVLLDAGTVSATAASTNYSITISQAITAGWYWLALNWQTAATTNSFDGFTNGIGVPNPLYPRLLTNGNAQLGFSQSVTVTSGFATAASLSDTGTGFRIAVRAA
jgi:hypothetical protein